jgi:uncharacterized protein
MKIDAHGHACGEYVTTDHLVKKLNENKLDKVVLFPGETGSHKVEKVGDHKHKEVLYFTNIIGTFFGKFLNLSPKIDRGNAYVYQMQQDCPERIVQFYWLTPQYLQRLAPDYQTMQFSGIKLHQCIDYFDINGSFFRQALDFAEANRLPILIHLYGKKDANHLIEAIKERDVTVTVAHLFHYKVFAAHWPEIQRQVYFDIANYYLLNTSTILAAIQAFGCAKLIFGGDNPYGENCIEKTMRMVAGLPIAESDKAQILGKNMQKILGI